MTEQITLTPIGKTGPQALEPHVQILPPYRTGLRGLGQFSHGVLLWWAHADAPADAPLICRAPYRFGPPELGVFATRSEHRPNAIAMTVFAIVDVDPEAGVVRTPFLDTVPGTPVLDIKPYFPASDRALSARVPAHFSHWPQDLEASAHFDWSGEFDADTGFRL